MQAPIADGFVPRTQSKNIHASIAAADAVLVVAKAIAAVALAPGAEPALKPNQPNHSMPVPRSTKGTLPGTCVSPSRWLCRRPRTIAPASAASPADMWTTVPPAKSSTPHLRRKPSGCHVQWASGQ